MKMIKFRLEGMPVTLIGVEKNVIVEESSITLFLIAPITKPFMLDVPMTNACNTHLRPGIPINKIY
jgi:hypothetical protein